MFLIHRITQKSPRIARAAGWALLFALGSGAFVANAISFYSLQAHLTANLLFAALLLRPTDTVPWRRARGITGADTAQSRSARAVRNPWMVAMALDRRSGIFACH